LPGVTGIRPGEYRSGDGSQSGGGCLLVRTQIHSGGLCAHGRVLQEAERLVAVAAEQAADALPAGLVARAAGMVVVDVQVLVSGCITADAASAALTSQQAVELVDGDAEATHEPPRSGPSFLCWILSSDPLVLLTAVTAPTLHSELATPVELGERLDLTA